MEKKPPQGPVMGADRLVGPKKRASGSHRPDGKSEPRAAASNEIRPLARQRNAFRPPQR